MKWSNLKSNKCPQCNKDLTTTMVAAPAGFIACRCGFKISEQRMLEIVSDRVNRNLEESRQSEEDTSLS